MAEKYETIAHRWFEEVWNQQREESIDEIMHEECVAYGLNDSEGNPLRGPEGFENVVPRLYPGLSRHSRHGRRDR